MNDSLDSIFCFFLFKRKNPKLFSMEAMSEENTLAIHVLVFRNTKFILRQKNCFVPNLSLFLLKIPPIFIYFSLSFPNKMSSCSKPLNKTGLSFGLFETVCRNKIVWPFFGLFLNVEENSTFYGLFWKNLNKPYNIL